MNKRLRHLTFSATIADIDLNKFYSIRLSEYLTYLQGEFDDNKELLKKFKFTSNDSGMLESQISKHIKIVLS